MKADAQSKSLIVGAGKTGHSIARYLDKQDIYFDVFDTRVGYSEIESFRQYKNCERTFLGEINLSDRFGLNRMLVSPGVDHDIELLHWALENKIPVLGDVALFCAEVKKPVIGITGSNGKSTVTTMIFELLKSVGLRVAVGGNLGEPALDLIDDGIEIYVLELSSFQLESSRCLNLEVAVHLNVSPDHLDRHKTVEKYVELKRRIFDGAAHAVFNANDESTYPNSTLEIDGIGFGLAASIHSHVKLKYRLSDSGALMVENRELMRVDDVALKGTHNIENVLACFAVAELLNVPEAAVVRLAQDFKGLAHRCEFVRSINGVDFINDSKATNVGAALAAVKGFSGQYDNFTLIAGGQSKGADFFEFGCGLKGIVQQVVLIGEDSLKIKECMPEGLSVSLKKTLAEALAYAHKKTKAKGLVLFAPACASFDMFKNYEDRGNTFKNMVMAL